LSKVQKAGKEMGKELGKKGAKTMKIKEKYPPLSNYKSII